MYVCMYVYHCIHTYILCMYTPTSVVGFSQDAIQHLKTVIKLEKVAFGDPSSEVSVENL